MKKIALLSVVPLSALLLVGSPVSAAPAPAAAACRAIEGADAVLKPGRIVLLGEVHGTAESPAFVADLACLALQRGDRVTVGLEISENEAPRVKSYLASGGTPKDRADLLAGDFWHASLQDGRSSQAMADLLESLRKLARGGKPLQVDLFDPAKADTPQDRDRGMAAHLGASFQRSPGDLFLVLTGNVHSRAVQGTPWDAKYEPLGLLLTRTYGDKVVPLNVSSPGGTAWICLSPSDCNGREIKGSATDTGAPKVTLGDQRDPAGYLGKYFVGKVNASPPAIGPAPETKPAPKPEGR